MYCCEVIYENVSYIELRILNQVSHDRRSFERNLGNCKQKPENSGLQRGLNPWPRETGATF